MHAHPRKPYYVAVYAPAERADILSLFHLYPICTRCLQHSVISHLLNLVPVFGLYGAGCRTALPKEGRTQLDILSEMGRGTSLDIYLGGGERSMDLDLLRTVTSQARGFLSISEAANFAQSSKKLLCKDQDPDPDLHQREKLGPAPYSRLSGPGLFYQSPGLFKLKITV